MGSLKQYPDMSMGPEHDEHVNLCRRCIGWRFSETDGSLKIQLKRKKKEGREVLFREMEIWKYFLSKENIRKLSGTPVSTSSGTFSCLIIAALQENWSDSISQIHFIFNKSLALLLTPALR